jgi:hypothetical protein
MAEEKKMVKKPFKGAKVDWPADMPDDMLEDAITVSKKALEEHDFEENGVEVSLAPLCVTYLEFLDRANREEAYG